jgi:hypothetical protein
MGAISHLGNLLGLEDGFLTAPGLMRHKRNPNLRLKAGDAKSDPQGT